MSPTKDKPARWMGPPIAKYKGLRIHARLRDPKTERGRPRLLIAIRPDAGKPRRWRIAENLSYVNSVDIYFVNPLPECPEPAIHRRRSARTTQR